MKLFIVLSAFLVVCLAEAPFNGYEPSGWKPQGATFDLPNEYRPPQETKQQPAEVEITQEEVEYDGQLGETTTLASPSNEYLPAGTENPTAEAPEDVLRVQGLPKADQYTVFNNQLRSRANLRQQVRSNFRQAPQPQRSFNPRTAQFTEFAPQTQKRNNNNGFRSGRIQAQQKNNFRQFGRQEVEPTVQNVPAEKYGPPQQQYGPPQQQYGPPTTEQPKEDVDYEEPEQSNEEKEKESEDVSGEEQPAIAVSNASNGQYYILAQDNTLQKVVFMTSQTEDDRRNNGFTAQLKYAPVEPIRDPIYAYNQQGQLVRVYNKK